MRLHRQASSPFLRHWHSLFPLLIWLRYAREISSSGGLFSFVEAAAGRRVALVQAAIWTVSYLLYLVYTTVYVVFDVLPSVLPGGAPVSRHTRGGDPGIDRAHRRRGSFARGVRAVCDRRCCVSARGESSVYPRRYSWRLCRQRGRRTWRWCGRRDRGRA